MYVMLYIMYAMHAPDQV